VTKVEIELYKYTVHGYFVLVTLMTKGLERGADLHYLTPPGEPFKLTLPPWIFKDRPVDEISPKAVTEALVQFLGQSPFEVAPPAPSDIPWHKIPPSKHKTVKAAREKAETAKGPSPPEEEML
jgi:hypothetical protein